MESEDFVKLMQWLNIFGAAALWTAMWLRHPERRFIYACVLIYAVYWTYWHQQKLVADTAHEREYGPPPPNCGRGYTFSWTRVSDSSVKECDAYLRAIAAAPVPEVDLFLVTVEFVTLAVVIAAVDSFYNGFT